MCVCESVCIASMSVCGQKLCQRKDDITLPTPPTRPTVNDYPQSHHILPMGTVLTTPESLDSWL